MLDRDKVDVEITDIDTFDNEEFNGFMIRWSGNIGFGEYTIYKDKKSGKWHADSECMDSTDDHWFLNLLLNDLANNLIEEIRS